LLSFYFILRSWSLAFFALFDLGLHYFFYFYLARPCQMTFDQSNLSEQLFFMDEMKMRGEICKGVMYGWDMDMLHSLDH
jgi:hypothetical protein